MIHNVCFPGLYEFEMVIKQDFWKQVTSLCHFSLSELLYPTLIACFLMYYHDENEIISFSPPIEDNLNFQRKW